MTPAQIAKQNRTRVLLAFAAVYVIWGSTYLLIRFSIETIPPFLMGAMRYLIAGTLLYAFAVFRKAPKPTRAELQLGIITGLLMPGMGNGGASFVIHWADPDGGHRGPCHRGFHTRLCCPDRDRDGASRRHRVM